MTGTAAGKRGESIRPIGRRGRNNKQYRHWVYDVSEWFALNIFELKSDFSHCNVESLSSKNEMHFGPAFATASIQFGKLQDWTRKPPWLEPNWIPCKYQMDSLLAALATFYTELVQLPCYSLSCHSLRHPIVKCWALWRGWHISKRATVVFNKFPLAAFLFSRVFQFGSF